MTEEKKQSEDSYKDIELNIETLNKLLTDINIVIAKNNDDKPTFEKYKQEINNIRTSLKFATGSEALRGGNNSKNSNSDYKKVKTIYDAVNKKLKNKK